MVLSEDFRKNLLFFFKGKKQIYLKRNTLIECGPSQKERLALEYGMVNFYGLGNFIG